MLFYVVLTSRAGKRQPVDRYRRISSVIGTSVSGVQSMSPASVSLYCLQVIWRDKNVFVICKLQYGVFDHSPGFRAADHEFQANLAEVVRIS